MSACKEAVVRQSLTHEHRLPAHGAIQPRAVIPVASVQSDYFPHLTAENFLRQVSADGIQIPLERIGPSSQEAAEVYTSQTWPNTLMIDAPPQ